MNRRFRGPAEFYLVAGAVFAASLAVTILFCRSMPGGMEMPGGWTMSMMWMRMPGQSWLESAAVFLMMWLAMMVAMMLPSALPMLQKVRSSQNAGTAALVACAYFAVWTAIGAAVYVAGASWGAALMRWPALSRAVPLLTGATLTLAGAIQFSRWSRAGLEHCRDPHGCGAAEMGRGQRAAWLYGIRQGMYCGTCCTGPMMALVAIGTMNLYGMIVVAAVIAAEKLLPEPQRVMRLTGVLAIIAGLLIMIRIL